MGKKSAMVMLFLVAVFCRLKAQDVEVTGRVTNEAGTGIAGATVQEKNSQRGTSTDGNGFFRLTVLPRSTLVFSSIGFQTIEMSAGAAGSTINVTLREGNQALNEVVVTALGIRREKKALGYAVSTINKKELEQRGEGDIARVLNGKAPGVTVLNTSGLSGSGTNIIIRSVSSITGNSTPLFVVDGVPFNASTNAQSDFRYGSQTSSRFLDLDPNSIESIDILKGLSATTLYGESGRNGVVLITTKNGANRKVNRKAEVTVDQSFFLNTVSNLPEYQTNWGGGIDNVFTPAFSNWGARITDPPTIVKHYYDRADLNPIFPELIGAPYEYRSYNPVKNFFRTGKVSTTSVNLSGGSGNTTYNMTYGYLDDEGFTPGNQVRRNTFGLGGSAKLANNLTASGTFNYTLSDFVSPPTGYSTGSGAVLGSSAFGDLWYTPPTVDLMGLPYENPLTKGTVYYRLDNAIQNPRWTVANSFVSQRVNRIFGNAQLKYDLFKGLNVTYRFGYDRYTEDHTVAQNKGGTDGPVNGLYRTIRGNNHIWDHTLIFNYNGNLSTDWSLGIDAGVNSREDAYQQTGVTSTQQLVFGLLDHSNFISKSSIGDDPADDLDYETHQQNIGVFAQAQFGFREYLFVNVGGRNGWSSTLEKGNNSLFYPSVSASFIPSSAFAFLQQSRVVNYLKVRGGYSTSARFPLPYNTRPGLNILSNVFVARDGSVVNSNSLSRLAPNPDLKPELLSEVEVGVEAKLFNNRGTIDLTLYRRFSKDQILQQDLDPSTGFDLKTVNAGNLTNRGIELGLGYAVIKTANLTWQIDGNFTLNRSKVSGMPDEIEQIVTAGFTNRGNIARNGEPLGVLYGTYRVIDEKNGLPVINELGRYEVSPDQKIIGDPNPDYRLVGISTLTFKGFSFRMQWDYTKGGDMFSMTAQTLLARGVTKDTDFDRFLPLIPYGSDGNGNISTLQLTSSNAYFEGLLNAPDDVYLYDATNIRLRELSLTYALPQTLLKRTPFGNIALTLSGQNMWYKAPYFPEYTNIDPETTSLGVSNSRGFDYMTAPSSRRIGASLRVTF
jgi:TonB-linked SusC/RagA family outer membrane protein